MNVLTPHQQDLLHRELDGETTPEESIEARNLMAAQPEALEFMTSLRDLDALFHSVPRHASPPGLRQRIYGDISSKPGRSRRPGRAGGSAQSVTSWISQHWDGVRNLTEELMQTKKVLVGAAAAIAVIAVIGHFVVGYPPSIRDAGTIGAGTIGASDSITGVQQAGRYQGRTMTEADVTLSNPEVQALFQDDKILKLVQSDVFRTVMRDESFRALQSNAAYQALQSSADYKALQSNAEFKALQSNAEFKALQSNADFKALQSNADFKALQSNAAFKALQSNADFKALQSNAEYQALQSNAAYQALQSNAAYQALQTNAAWQALQSNAAYQTLAASQTFRALARDQAASEAFLTQAMRAQQ
ncbi:MAG TPA: hypothetical protein VFS94_03420 [Gemmatimonadales bacterium]|nr:hypothetical protein [Gemmatimonadales bacterium]